MSIKLEILNRKFRINEPEGADAMELYCLAMEALEARGALEAMADAANPEAGTLAAARRIAAAGDVGLAAVKATLIGSTSDGEVITAETFRKDYTEHGRFSEPFLVAVVAWDRLGFLSVTAATKPEKPKEPDGPTEEAP